MSLHIVTNFERFPLSWEAGSGETGTSTIAVTIRDLAAASRNCDLVLLDGSATGLVMQMAALMRLPAWRRIRLVVVDLVLRVPEDAAGRAALFLKRPVLARVDHFIHHFRDVSRYDSLFRIGADRSGFVPYKANIFGRAEFPSDSSGEYVVCFGRSRRDYETFFNAVAQLPYPAAIARPNVAELRAHGSRFTRSLDDLPKNVRLLENDGSMRDMIRILERARIVALPVVASSLVAAIAVYMNAMIMRKCVILSEGPGASDILTKEALFVPREDPRALTAMIRRAWEDPDLCERTAAAGYEYALGLGGERELRQRVLDHTVTWYRASQ